MRAHARTTDRDQADPLIVAPPELRAQRRSLGQRRRVEPRDVPAEVEALLDPRPDLRQPRPEAPGHDVLRIADEDRAVAHPGIALDLLDHLGVVVGGQERLALPALRQRQVADEVGQPDVRRSFELGILVQEVVDIPGLVADPEVVLPLLRDFVEEHEVREQDLVHTPHGIEHRAAVLAGLRLDVRALAREFGAGRMDALAARLEHRGRRRLRQPVDLETRPQTAQLARDREIAPSVPEADRRGDEERAQRPHARPLPAGRRRRRQQELAQQQVDAHRVARVRRMAAALERDQPAPGRRRETGRLDVRANGVLLAVDHEHGAAHATRQIARLGLAQLRRVDGLGKQLARGPARPFEPALDLPRRMRLGEDSAEEPLGRNRESRVARRCG